MTIYNEVQLQRIFVGKLKHGSDLLEELTSVCVHDDIHLGRVEAIGAVTKARLCFYNQQERKYDFFEIKENLEITALLGNISMRDGKPMVHAHITLSDAQGRAYGGHLALGTVVFACEFSIDVYQGPRLLRAYDEETGLPLWDM
ncbi:MAG: PPC domain-containing DNA-binding protein [Planctomycetota bacterium]|jgi:predicted DNA-binding protein with PD1-like motif